MSVCTKETEKWWKAIKRGQKVRVKKLNECKINEGIVCPNKCESKAIWNGFFFFFSSMRIYVFRGSTRCIHALYMVEVVLYRGHFFFFYFCSGFVFFFSLCVHNVLL